MDKQMLGIINAGEENRKLKLIKVRTAAQWRRSCLKNDG